MNILTIGLNHKTSPVDIRQKIAFDHQTTQEALKVFKQRFPSAEFVLLSTCNRVELYTASEKPISPVKLAECIAEIKGQNLSLFRKHLYVMRTERAVRHLLTVASSLDSMVVGENQILSQVKQSYSLAVSVKATGKVLNHLFHVAFAVAKQVFTKTSIAERRISVAGVAVQMAKQLFAQIQTAKIVVIGAGQMAELFIDHFKHIKCRDITIINRTGRTACSLASRKSIKSAGWDMLASELVNADIMVAAVSAGDEHLITYDQYSAINTKRSGREALILDIAVPRSFDPRICEFQSTRLCCIDDLSQVAEENIRLRAGDVELAVEIICQSTSEFIDWFEMIEIGPIIGQIRNAFEQIKQEQMDNFFSGARAYADCKSDLDAAVNKIVGRLLHCVIKNIEHTARSNGPYYAAGLAKKILNNAKDIVTEHIDSNV